MMLSRKVIVYINVMGFHYTLINNFTNNLNKECFKFWIYACNNWLENICFKNLIYILYMKYKKSQNPKSKNFWEETNSVNSII